MIKRLDIRTGPVTLLIAAALLMTSCAGTTLTSVWKDEAYHKTPRKVLVVGMVWDPENRRHVENEFVGQLKASGLDPVAGSTVLPEDKLPDKDVVAARLKEVGIDTLFLFKLVDKTASLHYVEDSAHYRPMYSSWPGYYGGGYVTATEQTYAFVEIRLYDVETEKLIWSADSETEIRSDLRTEIKSYAAKILKALRKENLIP